MVRCLRSGLTRVFAMLAIVCGVSMTATGAAAAYPDRPLRYVLPSAAGGGPDVAARVVMAELSRQTAQ